MQKKLKNPAPTYNDVVKAIGYWIVIDEVSGFFKEADMPQVHQHLMMACQEIDRIWSNYDYRN